MGSGFKGFWRTKKVVVLPLNAKINPLNKMYKAISAGLFAAVLVLGYLVYDSIKAPVAFKKRRDMRYRAAIAKLIKIRDAEMAYKTVNNEYTGDFAKLFEFLDTGRFVLTSRRDTVFKVYDKVYRIDKEVDSVIVDTLGFRSVKDSLFKNYDYHKLENVPFTEGKKFQLKADTLEKNAMLNPVFYARVSKEVLLNGMNRQLVKEETINRTAEVQGKYVQVGDLKKITTNGNWPKRLEPGYKPTVHKR